MWETRRGTRFMTGSGGERWKEWEKKMFTVCMRHLSRVGKNDLQLSLANVSLCLFFHVGCNQDTTMIIVRWRLGKELTGSTTRKINTFTVEGVGVKRQQNGGRGKAMKGKVFSFPSRERMGKGRLSIFLLPSVYVTHYLTSWWSPSLNSRWGEGEKTPSPQPGFSVCCLSFPLEILLSEKNLSCAVVSLIALSPSFTMFSFCVFTLN